MKKIQFIIGLFIIASLAINAQEKKIKFSKGTLEICSSKNFTIEGHDGDEVIIESLHPKRNNIIGRGYNLSGNAVYNSSGKSNKEWKVDAKLNNIQFFPNKKSDTTIHLNNFRFFTNDSKRKKGLKKLGKNNEDKELGIYFTIEQKGDELIFKDNTDGQLVMISNEKYNIKIPNSLKLKWSTEGCEEKNTNDNKYFFLNSKPSSLSNFEGEVEISTSLNNMELTDVTGPVSINTIGGNVTVNFDKKIPKKLYSIYTNNGFIDITLPENSDIIVDADANSVFSDIDFNVLEESTKNDMQQMKLKLKKGNVKMKLNAGLGNVYLRKK